MTTTAYHLGRYSLHLLLFCLNRFQKLTASCSGSWPSQNSLPSQTISARKDIPTSKSTSTGSRTRHFRIGMTSSRCKTSSRLPLKKVLGRPKLIKMANIGHDWTLNPKTPILWTLICDCSNPYKFCFYCSATHVTSQVLHPKSVPTQTV